MDGWMDGGRDVGMDGGMDEWREGGTDGGMYGMMDVWKDGLREGVSRAWWKWGRGSCGRGGDVGEKVWEGGRCKRGRRGGVREGVARCRRVHAFASLEFPKLANAQPSNFGSLPYFKLCKYAKTPACLRNFFKIFL